MGNFLKQVWVRKDEAIICARLCFKVWTRRSYSVC